MKTLDFKNRTKRALGYILSMILVACSLSMSVPYMKASAEDQVTWPVTTYSGQYKEELGTAYPYQPGAIYFYDKKDTLYVDKNSTLTLTFSSTNGRSPVYYIQSDTYAYPIGSGYGYGEGWQICTYDEAHNTVQDGNTMTFSYAGSDVTKTYVYTRTIGYDSNGDESNSLSGSIIIYLTINWGDGKAETKAKDAVKDPNYELYGKKFKHSGFTYSVISEECVSLVAIPVNSSGVIRIKDSVTYKGKKYRVATIGAKAFKVKNSVTSVVLGKNVVLIEQSAFAKLPNLRKITTGSSLVTIGAKAFYNSSNLHYVYIKSPYLNSIGKNAFKGVDRTANFRFPGIDSAAKKEIKKLLKKKSSGYKKTWVL